MKKYLLLILIFISCSKEEIKTDEYADCKAKISEYHISKADPATGMGGNIIQQPTKMSFGYIEAIKILYPKNK